MKDPELTTRTANLENVFVNSAFNAAHRAHLSVEGITKFLKPYVSGFLSKKELDYIKAAVGEPKRPMAAVVGGAKVSTKIPIIEPTLNNIDKLIIGGSIVFTILKVHGLSVGNSLVKADFVEGIVIIPPSNAACGDEFPAGSKEVGSKMMSADAVPDGRLGLNNGTNATKEINTALADNKTIIWNGPMGVESTQFASDFDELATSLEKGIKNLDKSVAEVAEQRKTENSEYKEPMASDTASWPASAARSRRPRRPAASP